MLDMASQSPSQGEASQLFPELDSSYGGFGDRVRLIPGILAP